MCVCCFPLCTCADGLVLPSGKALMPLIAALLEILSGAPASVFERALVFILCDSVLFVVRFVSTSQPWLSFDAILVSKEKKKIKILFPWSKPMHVCFSLQRATLLGIFVPTLAAIVRLSAGRSMTELFA